MRLRRIRSQFCMPAWARRALREICGCP
jgi:hypothetical protein